MNILRSIFVLILALLLAPIFAQAESPVGCPIQAPVGWTAIPRDALDAYQAETAKNTPHGNAPKYDCGFQASPGPPWMIYPFIVAYVQETGPIPESFLRELASLPVSDIAADWEEAFRKTIQEFKPGRPLWDSAARIVWLKTDMDLGSERKISTLSGMKLTDKGFIFAAGAALDHQYVRFAPTFMRVIGSIRPGLAGPAGR